MKKTRKKKQKLIKPNLPSGWRTTDEDEIERRRRRATDEGCRVERLSKGTDFFGNFRVSMEPGSSYRVEIRSLSELINTCECPDHRVNKLGTCKHIEAVLLHIQLRKKRAFQQAVTVGSRNVHIFLDRRDDKIYIRWPQRSQSRSEAHRRLDPYFDRHNQLKGDPLDTFPALTRAIGATSPSTQRNIHLSAELAPWLAAQDQAQQRVRNRRRFENRVAAGKQSLDLVKFPLYNYQQAGMLHLAFTGRALLADEMGLGKTVQAIAACQLLRLTRSVRRVLVISPASLKGEWKEQIEKFTDLPSVIVEGTRANRLRQYHAPAFFSLANYEQIGPDLEEINTVLKPDVIVLDEAQRIKNWRTKTASAVKKLKSDYAFVLTGTPVENRIDEIYSIVQFLDPQILGPLFRFNREFYQLDEKGRATGYQNLDVLHEKLQPVMLRRNKQEVEGQLPGLTVNTYFVPMHKEQVIRYEEFKTKVARLSAQAQKRPLTKEEFERLQRYLACMRMLCDTPYILDQACALSPKIDELEKLLPEVLADDQRKIIIFSEWERMLQLVRKCADQMGIGYALHTGKVSQADRRKEIGRFKGDALCRLFLSTDSGSVGLNLQAADTVINLDLPWNPAKLDQRIARAWRKHQTRPVQVINLVSANTIEQSMLSLLEQKRSLAQGVLEGKGNNRMDLPSGRSAMVDRISSLLDTEQQIQQRQTPEDPVEILQQELASGFSDQLLLAELHGQGPEQTLLLVVEESDGHLDEELKQLVAIRFPNKAPQLNILDRRTYNSIQRLIEAGVLSQTVDPSINLFKAGEPEKTKQTVSAENARKARALFAKGEHKHQMANVLAQGGFVIEALVPMAEVIEGAVQAALTYKGCKVDASVKINTIASELSAPDFQPDEIVSLIEQFRAGVDGSSSDEAANIFTQGNKLLNRIGAVVSQR